MPLDALLRDGLARESLIARRARLLCGCEHCSPRIGWPKLCFAGLFADGIETGIRIGIALAQSGTDAQGKS